MGNSTEHTAYQRLKQGIKAPASGSIALNGKTVAEQIGAQIFIDGWAMIAPGDPVLAADLARRAGSVSHDGEALYAAQVIAAMEAQAFVESDLNALLDTATGLIPSGSVVHRLIAELRDLRMRETDWRAARAWLEAHYGYQHYGGVCHVIPNHGLIILSLLYGEDDFQKTLMICNTSGWDTDCNSGNVGCLMGIKHGLAGIDRGPDWRGPVADRLYMPTADGGRSITDAVTETYHIVNIGRAVHGQPGVAPKGGARYHFDLPGSVQGFAPDDSVETRGTVVLENVAGLGDGGGRALAMRYAKLAPGRVARIRTATFIPAESLSLRTYELLASPALYPGQHVRARAQSDPANADPIRCRLFVSVYERQDGPGPFTGSEASETQAPLRDDLVRLYGPEIVFAPGAGHDLVWTIPETDCRPIAEIGLELRPVSGAVERGTITLDMLTWDGTPSVRLGKPGQGGALWSRAWVRGVDDWWPWWTSDTFRIMHNEGTGLLIQGTRDWRDYSVSARLTPHLTTSAGIAAYVQGMRRYYALVLRPGNRACLIKALDGETILAQADFPWEFDESHDLTLEVSSNRLRGWVDGRLVLAAADGDRPFEGGAVALLCADGCIESGDVFVRAERR